MHCTCPTPPNVDLTAAYVSKHTHDEKRNQNNNNNHPNQQLLDNLSRFGWSPISLQWDQLPFQSPLKHQTSLWKDPKTEIVKLFDPQVVIKNATYRTAESGSAGDTAVEPKQSWEVRRCHVYDTDDDTADANNNNNNNNNVLQDMTLALHSVIATAQSALQLPPNLLVQENTTIDNQNNDDYYRCDCLANRNIRKKEPCNVDLLRVFYYDQVVVKSDTTAPQNKNKTTTLGSSPHTDWGSWTVVWQDHVGGLETYCSACQQWNPVPTVAPDDDDGNTMLLHFVIHVGDATSLAMGHAMQTVYNNNNNNNAENEGSVVWPSPKHRVVSPTTEPRASLVYFLYPTPGLSLATLTQRLVPWVQQQQQQQGRAIIQELPIKIPYEFYYLLQDQSTSATADVSTLLGETSSQQRKLRSPKDMMNSFWDKPMQQVFADKWNQVQREQSY